MAKVYARSNEKNQVIYIFSDKFVKPKVTDVLIKEGVGSEFIHVGYYRVLDSNGCHNYKIYEGRFVECTEEDKEKEIESRPEPSKSEIEILQETIEEQKNIIYELSDQLIQTEMSLAEQLAANEEISNFVLDLDMRITNIENL